MKTIYLFFTKPSESGPANILEAAKVISVLGDESTTVGGQQWSEVSDVLAGQRHIKRNDPQLEGDDIGNCFAAAKLQNTLAGATPGDAMTGIYMKVDNSLQGADQLSANPDLAIETINNNLDQGNPTMVGIQYGDASGNPNNRNKLVGHFVNISGRDYDRNKGGNHFIYWDNSYDYNNTNLNIFTKTSNSGLFNSTNGRNHRVVEVRPNK